MKLFEQLIPDKYRLSPTGTVKLDISDSVTIKLKANQTSYILRELFWEKPLDYEYTSIFVQLIKQVGTFWDIGANIGYYSILACTYNPSIKVEAFEPSNGPKYFLNENILINEVVGQVRVHSKALSNKKGNIDFYEIVNPKFPNILNLSGEHNIGTKKGLNAKKVTVESIRIDDFNDNQLPVELIKIDVEGAEVMVLEGGLETLQRDRPIIICEVLFNQNEVELNSIMNDLNYVYFAHVKNGLVKIDSLLREKDNGIRNVFFVPIEKQGLIQNYIVGQA